MQAVIHGRYRGGAIASRDHDTAGQNLDDRRIARYVLRLGGHVLARAVDEDHGDCQLLRLPDGGEREVTVQMNEGHGNGNPHDHRPGPGLKVGRNRGGAQSLGFDEASRRNRRHRRIGRRPLRTGRHLGRRKVRQPKECLQLAGLSNRRQRHVAVDLHVSWRGVWLGGSAGHDLQCRDQHGDGTREHPIRGRQGARRRSRWPVMVSHAASVRQGRAPCPYGSVRVL